MNDTFTIALDDQIDVRQRVQQLCEWQEEWKKEDKYLAQRIQELSDTQLASQEGAQIGSLRRRLLLRQGIRPQVNCSVKNVRIKDPVICQDIFAQFVSVSPEAP